MGSVGDAERLCLARAFPRLWNGRLRRRGCCPCGGGFRGANGRVAPGKTRNEMSTYRIQGATGEWEVVIGLEVHAQVTSNAKLFSGASTAFGAEPNSQ